MPVISRDRLTRRMQGDPFGSVSARSRFVVGDPGLFSFLGRAIKGGFQFTKGAVKAQLGLPAAPAAQLPSTTALVKGGQRGALARIGTPERPAVIQIGGTRVPIPTDPLGLGAALGIRGPGGGFGRRRRMNVLNPRALRRSMRRVQGFARFASRTISFTKRVRMKKRRRRAA